MQTNPVILPSDHDLRRLPRRATLPRRGPKFFEQFEDRVLYFDCYRNRAGGVELIGPNPANLRSAIEGARFIALPEGRVLSARHHTGDPALVPTLYTQLEGVPANSTHLRIEIADLALSVEIGADVSAMMAGRRVMTTMNRDNPLNWVEDWCRWHGVMHGVDAVVLFDNASTRYGRAALQDAALRGLQGTGTAAPQVVVVDWPYRFGPYDPGVIIRPYWALMSQQAAMLTALRKFAPDAQMLLNCDVDELVGGEPLAEALDDSRDGLVVLRGNWILPRMVTKDTPPVRHVADGFTHLNPLKSICSSKWALRPAAAARPELVLKTHRILGLDAASAPRRPFYHFQSITTGWKDQVRSTPRRFHPFMKIHPPLEHDRAVFLQRWAAAGGGA